MLRWTMRTSNRSAWPRLRPARGTAAAERRHVLVHSVAELFLGERAALVGVPRGEPLVESAEHFVAGQLLVVVSVHGRHEERPQEHAGPKPGGRSARSAGPRRRTARTTRRAEAKTLERFTLGFPGHLVNHR